MIYLGRRGLKSELGVLSWLVSVATSCRDIYEAIAQNSSSNDDENKVKQPHPWLWREIPQQPSHLDAWGSY